MERLTIFVALLRAVNVGGTGKLPMAHLKVLGSAAGFANVRTYIASGNMVFASPLSEPRVKAALEAALHDYAGRPVGVVIRSAAEMAAVLAANPFSKAAPNRVVAMFLDDPPPPDVLKNAAGQTTEEVRLGKREIYVHYPAGIAASKLRIPAASSGTARNMNTVARLADMAVADH
jgi:uncharacterized protein (DUF1697 family)